MPISRSVATISAPSCLASIKMFDKIGIVLRFSTTPCTLPSPVSNSSLPIRTFIVAPLSIGRSASENLFLQPVQRLVQNGVAFFRLHDLPAGVHDRRVVFPAEQAAYFGKGCVGQFAAEEHGDLSGMHQRLAPAPRFEI